MITTAILLAAGEGSRLRGSAPLKPLCRVAGRTLIAHAIHRLAAAGIARVVVVLGYGAEAIEAHLAMRAWPIALETVRVRDHREPNGSSLLAAGPATADAAGGALLAMCDHVVEPDLYRRLAAAGAGPGARLGVDRRLDNSWIDPLDVTCVRTEGERIVAIGKELERFDCYDTGVFAIGPALFAALRTLSAPSLTEGMRVLARGGDALAVDCSDLRWIDVDDGTALAHAEGWMAAA